MADGSCDRDDFAQQETSLSSNQAVFPDDEIKQEVKQEVSTPIPGFPPLFQFAKVLYIQSHNQFLPAMNKMMKTKSLYILLPISKFCVNLLPV